MKSLEKLNCLFIYVCCFNFPSKLAKLSIFHKHWVRYGVLLFVSCVVCSRDAREVPCYNKWRCFMLIANKLFSLSYIFQVMWHSGRPLGRAEQWLWINTVSPFSNDVWNPKLIQMYDLPSLCLLSSDAAKPMPLPLAYSMPLMKTTGLRRTSVLSSPERREKLFYSFCHR